MPSKNPQNKKIYFTLLSASVISIIAVLPYAFTLQADLLKLSPLPLPVLALISIVQSSILFAIAIYLGLKLSNKVGLGLPILENYFKTKMIEPSLKSIFLNSGYYGVIAGGLIIIFDFVFKYLGVSITLGMNQIPPLWQRVIASLYGGISEELLLRLFFMSLVIWIFSKIMRTKTEITKNNFIMWFSIIFAAIIFGLGHLPITSSLTAITPLVISRAIILNGIGGIIFGWLFWKKGLEHAMIAHFTADIVILAIFPLIISFFN
ncbi:MAG: CPBP family glutamic-type intramembrane protease [Patescibacteria group bacterium]|nr:CPBP family glutamic-type intramembrane protease [Patescibacteria group bacterium]